MRFTGKLYCMVLYMAKEPGRMTVPTPSAYVSPVHSYVLTLLYATSGKGRTGMCSSRLWISSPVRKWERLRQEKKGMLGDVIPWVPKFESAFQSLRKPLLLAKIYLNA